MKANWCMRCGEGMIKRLLSQKIQQNTGTIEKEVLMTENCMKWF